MAKHCFLTTKVGGGMKIVTYVSSNVSQTGSKAIYNKSPPLASPLTGHSHESIRDSWLRCIETSMRLLCLVRYHNSIH
jgi:hypothetical protein